MRQRLWFAGALALELGSWALLLWRSPIAAQAALFTLAHGGASLVAALILQQLLPASLREPRGAAVLFLFTVTFFLPFVGVIGLATGVLVALRWPRRAERVVYFATTALPELPFRPLRMTAEPVYGEGYLVGLLRHSQNPELRLKAVMATRQLDDKLAVPILRTALGDPVDDVRLLAYAMLDDKEHKLYGRIQREEKALAPKQGVARASAERSLAEDFWEIAYLTLAQGEMLKHVLTQAHVHAEAALAIAPENLGLRYLLGRVQLKQGNLDGAQQSFEAALAGGVAESAVLPYLAEVAFLQRRFDLVRRLLAAVAPSAVGRPPLSQIVKYWS